MQTLNIQILIKYLFRKWLLDSNQAALQKKNYLLINIKLIEEFVHVAVFA